VLLASLAFVCVGAADDGQPATGAGDVPENWRAIHDEARNDRRPSAATEVRSASAAAPAADSPQSPKPPGDKPIEIGDPFEGLATQELIRATGEECPIDLSMALRLAEAENPTIALGRQAIQEALALQLQARALMLPSLNAGAMYHLHQGALQAANGQIMKVDSQSVYFGSGDWTYASQTVLIPGVQIFGNLGDAYYAPLAAAQVVNSRSADSRGIENQVLLEVATLYLNLVKAEADLASIRQSEESLGQVLKATATFAEKGQGRLGDYHRSRTTSLLLHSREQRTQETVAVAAAELGRRLHLDPSVRLKTGGGTIEVVQLVDPAYSVDELVQIAQMARPEAAARSADIAAADYRLKQEYARPFLPLLSVGFSAGGFGGGSDLVNSSFQRVAGRTDFDVYAVWTLDNLGFGNAAIQKERLAERDEAVARRGLILNQIGREVADAYAFWLARRQDLDFARQRLKTAVEGAGEEIARTRGGESLPLEAINSVDLLVTAREELIAALIGYDLSQFQLFIAIGQTPNAAVPAPVRGGAAPADNR